MKRFGIVYHPLNENAPALAVEIESFLLSKEVSTWLCSSWEGDSLQENLPLMDFVITVGGDGTILRTAQAIVPHAIPIIGVNLGKIGYLTEIEPDEALEKIALILDGGGRTDERAMLEARLFDDQNCEISSFKILNDVVVARGEIARIINVTAYVDGELLTTYRSDGVICATATGSTGYSMAAGGPILHPQSSDYLLVPIVAHMSFNKILIISPESVVRLRLSPIHKAILSIDGHIGLPVEEGWSIEVSHSKVKTCFHRINPKGFYAGLEQKIKR
jgi:NAD+ kinase